MQWIFVANVDYGPQFYQNELIHCKYIFPPFFLSSKVNYFLKIMMTVPGSNCYNYKFKAENTYYVQIANEDTTATLAEVILVFLSSTLNIYRAH